MSQPSFGGWVGIKANASRGEAERTKGGGNDDPREPSKQAPRAPRQGERRARAILGGWVGFLFTILI